MPSGFLLDATYEVLQCRDAVRHFTLFKKWSNAPYLGSSEMMVCLAIEACLDFFFASSPAYGQMIG
jgi:hypothetical protein